MNLKPNLSQVGNQPISAYELERLGISRNELRRLLKADKILRIGRGIYQLPSVDIGDENQFRVASKRIRGTSAICLLSALAFYNLTDEIPKQVWLLVDVNRRTYQKDIRLFRSHNPYWKVGIVPASGYRITNVERTIVDCLAYQYKFGNIGVEALKRALKSKQTTLNKIINMAEQLEVGNRISPYIQVLL